MVSKFEKILRKSVKLRVSRELLSNSIVFTSKRKNQKPCFQLIITVFEELHEFPIVERKRRFLSERFVDSAENFYKPIFVVLRMYSKSCGLTPFERKK